MQLSRRDLVKLTALGSAPIALADCGQSSNLGTGEGGDERPVATVFSGSGEFTRNFTPHSPSVVPMVQGTVFEPLAGSTAAGRSS